MRSLILLLSVVLPSSFVCAKSVGNQYIYSCTSENGDFKVQVITKDGKRTSAMVGNLLENPKSLEFHPYLGAKQVKLYFVGAPGSDEQNNICQLEYTNAQ